MGQRPVQIRGTTAVAGLPADPLQRLAQTQALSRAERYSNAFVRAGWDQWELSLKQAQLELGQDNVAQATKLKRLELLTQLEKQLQGDLSALRSQRFGKLADMERDVYREENDSLRADASAINAAERTGFEQAGANSRALLSSQTTLRRGRESDAAYASRPRSSGSYGSDGVFHPTKEVSANDFAVRDALRYYDPNDPKTVDSAMRQLEQQIQQNPYSDKNPTAIDLAKATLLDELGTTKALHDRTDPRTAVGDLIGSLNPTDRGQVERGLRTRLLEQQNGRIPGDGRPGSSPADSGGRASVTAPTGPDPSIRTRVGTPNVQTIGGGRVVLDNGASSQLASEEEERLAERLRRVEEAIGFLGPDQDPDTDLIGRARDIYARHFTSKGKKQTAEQEAKAKVDVPDVEPEAQASGSSQISHGEDPLGDIKKAAAKRATEIMGAYRNRLGSDDARKKWEASQKSEVYGIVRDLFGARGKNADPSSVASEIRRLYGEDPASLEEAMASFIVLSSLDKEGQQKQSAASVAPTPEEIEKALIDSMGSRIRIGTPVQDPNEDNSWVPAPDQMPEDPEDQLVILRDAIRTRDQRRGLPSSKR